MRFECYVVARGHEISRIIHHLAHSLSEELIHFPIPPAASDGAISRVCQVQWYEVVS